jgi:PAS domain S-box-containing protein
VGAQRWVLSRLATVSLAAAVLLTVGVGVTAWRAVQELIDVTAALRRSVERTAQASTVLAHLLQVESSQRGFLVTGDPAFLGPFETNVAKTREAFVRLQSLAETSQPERFDEISALVDAKLHELELTVELARERDAATAVAVVRGGIGKELMDELRGALESLQRDEAQIAAVRLGERADSISAARLGALGAAGLASLLLVVATVALDAAARRRLDAERRAVEGEERLRVTLASIGDAVIATDAGGRVVFLNPVAEELTGWKLPDAFGEPLATIFRIVDEETHAPAEDPVAIALREGRIVGLANHTVLISKEGIQRPIDDSAAPIRDAGGDVMGVVLVFRDASDRRRQRDDQIAARRAALERDAAESANRLKDQFLATLSHELRSPLGAMLSWIEVARSGAGDDPAILTRALDTVERNARHQAKLIDDLLDVSRIVSGKLTLDRTRVDLAALTRSALEEVAPTLSARRIRVEHDLPSQPVVVSGDAARLQQLVTNLLTNAQKFTPDDGWVRVEIERRASSVALRIRDSGEGIAPGFLPHVFERFRQGGDGASPRAGLGLGLAIVKQIASAHGGEVTAESPGEGHGATFTVTLPMAPAGTDGPPSVRSASL